MDDEHMVDGFCLPNKYFMVDICWGGAIDAYDCIDYHYFHDDQGGISQPGEKFKIGIKLLHVKKLYQNRMAQFGEKQSIFLDQYHWACNRHGGRDIDWTMDMG